MNDHDWDLVARRIRALWRQYETVASDSARAIADGSLNGGDEDMALEIILDLAHQRHEVVPSQDLALFRRAYVDDTPLGRRLDRFLTAAEQDARAA